MIGVICSLMRGAFKLVKVALLVVLALVGIVLAGIGIETNRSLNRIR